MMKDNQPYTLEELVKKTDRDFSPPGRYPAHWA